MLMAHRSIQGLMLSIEVSFTVARRAESSIMQLRALGLGAMLLDFDIVGCDLDIRLAGTIARDH